MSGHRNTVKPKFSCEAPLKEKAKEKKYIHFIQMKKH